MESEETEKVHLSFVRYILLASLAYLTILKGNGYTLLVPYSEEVPYSDSAFDRHEKGSGYKNIRAQNSSTDAGTNEIIMRHRYTYRLDIMPTRTRQFLTCICKTNERELVLLQIFRAGINFFFPAFASKPIY